MLQNFIGAVLGVSFLFLGSSVKAHFSLPAYDVTAASIQAFMDELPGDRVGDWPTRTVDAGIRRIEVCGAFRALTVAGATNLHEVARSEVYYMLEGAATLVTGSTLSDPRRPTPESTSMKVWESKGA